MLKGKNITISVNGNYNNVIKVVNKLATSFTEMLKVNDTELTNNTELKNNTELTNNIELTNNNKQATIPVPVPSAKDDHNTDNIGTTPSEGKLISKTKVTNFDSSDFGPSITFNVNYGELCSVREMFDRGNISLDNVLENAAYLGHMKTVVWAALTGARKIDDAMKFAAVGGHLPIVQWLYTHGAKDVNTSLCKAAESGRLEVVQWLISKGANFIHASLTCAVRRDHLPVVKYLFNHYLTKSLEPNEWGKYRANYLTGGLDAAAGEGHLSMVQWLIHNGATYMDNALLKAVEGGHLLVVQEFVDQGVGNIDDALNLAIEKQQLNIVQYLHNTKIDKA